MVTATARNDLEGRIFFVRIQHQRITNVPLNPCGLAGSQDRPERDAAHGLPPDRSSGSRSAARHCFVFSKIFASSMCMSGVPRALSFRNLSSLALVGPLSLSVLTRNGVPRGAFAASV